MKILFTFGGIPIYMDALLRKLTDKGLDIVAVIPSKSSAVLGKGVKTIAKSASTSYKIIEAKEKHSWLGKNYFQNLPDIIKNESPDVVVMGWPYFLAYFHQKSLRKAISSVGARFMMREIPFQVPPFGKAKSFFQTHPMYNEEMELQSKGFGFWLRQWAVMIIRSFCYKRADGALVYASIGKEILPTYGIAPEKVFVTYNTGDDVTLREEKNLVKQLPPLLPPNSQRILHIGRLVKWKRVDLLLKAMSMVIKEFPTSELIIIGDGPELENLKAQAVQLNIQHNVLFVGGIYDPQTMGAYMHASSVYVLAGMGGLSINDAMTYELPVICSVCDGTEKDLVSNGINGFFFKENDSQDLTEKILHLFRHPDQQKIMGRAALYVIENRINLEKVSENYMKAFIKS